jgi:RimJ/RimL family protein N-acetyltransferase
VPLVPTIHRLTAGHAAALLAFERENRAYFAASVSDRGDDYFADFAAHHRALLAEQDTGAIHLHVVLDGEAVVGRVNLFDVADGSADLGFRVAERVAGRGLATAVVGELCVMAATTYGLSTLRAAAAVANIGSRTVLSRNGFTPTGDEVDLNGRTGLAYLRHLPG